MLPHSDAALSDGLTGRQLQEEQGNAHNNQQQHIEEEKGSWGEKVNRFQLANELLLVCIFLSHSSRFIILVSPVCNISSVKNRLYPSCRVNKTHAVLTYILYINLMTSEDKLAASLFKILNIKQLHIEEVGTKKLITDINRYKANSTTCDSRAVVLYVVYR